MIRDYIIKDKLGTGSYGVVYKVTKKKDNNFYVLKQISLFGLTPSQIKDVKTEAELLSQMNSAYVVKYYDSFEEKNFLNIVMEFCDGGDLGRFLNYQMKTGRLLKEDVIWKLFIKICIGLGYLHKKKVLHRDLKSLNIFLTKGLDVKIGDLGVAKSLTQSGFAKTFIGTPYYLSPEICEEKPYNEKSDVWALGCILYEMCTYNHPFEAKTQAGLILKILKGKYQPIPSSYSYHLQKMIDLLLEKDYRKRPNVSDLFNRSIMIQKVKYNNLFDKALEVFPDIIDKEPSHHSGNNSEVPRSSSGIKHLKIVDKKPNRKVESEVKPVIKKSNANNNKLHHPQKEIIKMANRLNLGGVKIQMNRDGREGGLGCIAIPQNNKKEELPKKVLHKKIKIVDKKDSPDKKVDKKKVSGNVKFTIDKEKMAKVNIEIEKFERHFNMNQEKKKEEQPIIEQKEKKEPILNEKEEIQKSKLMQFDASSFINNLSKIPVDVDPSIPNASLDEFVNDLKKSTRLGDGDNNPSISMFINPKQKQQPKINDDEVSGRKTGLFDLINDYQNQNIPADVKDVKIEPKQPKSEYEIIKNSLFSSGFSEEEQEAPQPNNCYSEDDSCEEIDEETVQATKLNESDSDSSDNEETVFELDDNKAKDDEEDSQSQNQMVTASDKQKEENKKELLAKKEKIQIKIDSLKQDIISLLGEKDGKYIIDLYQSGSGDKDIDETSDKINAFLHENHSDKEDNFNNIYLLLVSYDLQKFYINKDLEQYNNYN